MSTTVINIKDAPKEWRDNPIYTFIGRPGLLGNPYKIGMDGDRLEVIEKFKLHLAYRRKTSPLAWDDFFKTMIKDHILVCHCHPLSCHGHILAHIADTEY